MTSNVAKKFGKELGEKPEEYIIGRLYLSSDGKEMFLIKERDGDSWLVDKCSRNSYDYGEWDTNVKLKNNLHYEHLILLPQDIKTMQEVERYMDESVGNALALIDSPDEQVMSESTAVVPTGKDELSRMLTVQKELIKLGNDFKIMEISLNEKREIMEKKVRHVKEQLERMQNVLDTVGLYLGIDEAIVQLQDGKEGDGPLCLRQSILYMDEEIAIHHFNEKGYNDGGADWRDIPQFDEWIRKNYSAVLPEEKGIVILKIRRFDKDYCNDPWTNYFANIPNKNTYFLIRNGEKLWRVWEDIQIDDRLFPKLGEIENMEDTFNRKQDLIQKFNKHMLAIQGILDRTGIFGNEKFDLMNPDEKCLKLIRDDEDLLPEGRLPWRKFKEEVNSKITIGTRFVLHANWRTWLHDNYGRQIPWHCEKPANGIYNCTRIATDVYSDKVYAKYWPGDNTYSWTTGLGERKNHKSFYMHRGDFILNYDEVSMDDLTYYINNRWNRRDYLDMVPVLMEMLIHKREEKVWEDNFKTFMKSEYFDSVDDIDTLMNNAIQWWKFKVIMKRPLKKEDAKAVRMIKGKLKKLIIERSHR